MSNTGKKQYDLTASGAGDVEALNKILNNINVQTKKNDYQNVDGKLPRKISCSNFYSNQREMNR